MTVPDDYARALSAHYGPPDLGARILAALAAAGKDPEALTLEDLAPVDQFHIRGREATLELARLAGLEPRMHVLDVGGGLGGPARTLAREVGCRVTVLDLIEAYCRVGTELTRRTRLADRVAFRRGDALRMPFAAGSFDAVWTQHSSMNIEDKERLYREVARVLRRGGRLALHEIMQGARAPVHFPVPWAREPSLSFLRPAAAVRTLLGDLGFAELSWLDVSGASLEWFRRQARAAERAPGAPRVGLQLLLGEDFVPMLENQRRNLEEGRIAVVMAVWGRP